MLSNQFHECLKINLIKNKKKWLSVRMIQTVEAFISPQTVSSIVSTITLCHACLWEIMYHMYDNNIMFCKTLAVYSIDELFLQCPVLTVMWLTIWCHTKSVWSISQYQSPMNQLESFVKRRVMNSLGLIPWKKYYHGMS